MLARKRTQFTLLSLCIIAVNVYMISAASRPNIVIVLIDDVGWNDLSFHGSDQIPTPNIDALAYNGVILKRHYVQPYCTPTRAALLTGRYPIHTSLQGEPITLAEPNGLPLNFKLMPEYLRDLGYRSHIVGKWHLGYFREAYTPLRRGFESHLGCLNGYTGYFDFIAETKDDENRVYNGLDIRRNETPAWDLVGKYSTDVFTNEAVRVIKTHPQDDPLFLYLAYTAGHATNEGHFLEAPQARVNSFKYILDPNRRTYAAMISKLDEGVGEVVDALRETGMLDNTIILFLSDNGSPSNSEVYPNWGSNFPFRGLKGTLWEGGVHTPSFIWSSQLQTHPRVSHQLMHVTDWLPTLYSAAGGNRFDLPGDLDGEDQWYPILWNYPSNREQALLNIDEKERSAAILNTFKSPDGNDVFWKLIVGSNQGGKYDGFYMDVSSPLTPPYDFRKVLSSKVYRALTTLFIPVNDVPFMESMRADSKVHCQDDFTTRRRKPNCTQHPCLFNLSIDPCERYDLASNNSALVQRMYNSLKLLRRTLIPQSNQPRDFPGADPARFNNTWSPWSA